MDYRINLNINYLGRVEIILSNHHGQEFKFNIHEFQEIIKQYNNEFERLLEDSLMAEFFDKHNKTYGIYEMLIRKVSLYIVNRLKDKHLKNGYSWKNTDINDLKERFKITYEKLNLVDWDKQELGNFQELTQLVDHIAQSCLYFLRFRENVGKDFLFTDKKNIKDVKEFLEEI